MSVSAEKTTSSTRALLAIALARQGKRKEAKRIADTVSLDDKAGPGSLYGSARMHAVVGSHQRALSLMTRSFEAVLPSQLGALKAHAKQCPEFASLVSLAGLVVPGDAPFDRSVRGGDFSHRLVPSDTPVGTLEEHHRSDAFDHSGIEADRNIGLPLDRLFELRAEGDIGDVAPRHIPLMGSITAPGRLRSHTLPMVADVLVDDGVDVALMVPM